MNGKKRMIFTTEELDELAAFDAEVDAQPVTLKEIAESCERDRDAVHANMRTKQLRRSAYMRKYREEHREEVRRYQRAYYMAHREEAMEYQRAYYMAHREEVREYKRAYYMAHLEEMRAYSKAYWMEHREEINARRRERTRALVRANLPQLCRGEAE